MDPGGPKTTDPDPEHWFRQVFQMHPVGVRGVWVSKLF
jgi:hypothetical protein